MAKQSLVKKQAEPRAEALAKIQAHPSSTTGVMDKLIALASDPGIDIAKIHALIDANVRLMEIDAKRQFDRAFAAMQGELPIVTARGLVTVSGSSRPFARTSDIARAVKPIMAKYGFAIRFRHVAQDGILTVTGILSHAAGHSEDDSFQTPRDDSGAKNIIQSWASARSYGQRYVTRALLNIASEVEDDDGVAAGPVETAPQPVVPARAASRDTAKITRGTKQKPGQVERLWVIIRNSGRNEQVVREWLHDTYGYTSTQDIRRVDYEAICEAVAATGDLPGRGREPGEEG